MQHSTYALTYTNIMDIDTNIWCNEKALRGDANTARWLYSNAEPKKFARRRHLRGRGTAKI